MGGLAWWHWVIIIAALVLIFGAKKLPDAARGLGRSMRILKSEVNAMHDDDSSRPAEGQQAAADPPAAPAAIAPVTPAAAAPITTPPAAPVPAQAAPGSAAGSASVQATTIDGKPAVIINGVPTLIDNQAS